MPPRAMKHQLPCPFERTSGSFLIGRRRILVIPRNHLVNYFSAMLLCIPLNPSVHYTNIWRLWDLSLKQCHPMMQKSTELEMLWRTVKFKLYRYENSI